MLYFEIYLKQQNIKYFFICIQVLKKAGADGKPTVFLFNDNQIKDESFVEDINMILNTGDVPNLYAADEKAEILEKMQAAARETVCYFKFLFVYLMAYFFSFKMSVPNIGILIDIVMTVTETVLPCKIMFKD